MPNLLLAMGEAEPCAVKLREQARMTSEVIRKDEYGDTDRVLSDYITRFDAKSGGFSEELEKLRTNGGLWVDGGARAAFPQRQFLRDNIGRGIHKDTRLLAVSVDLKPHLRAELESEKRVYSGAFESRIADLADVGSIAAGKRYALATDYLGGFSYSQRPLEVFENYINDQSDNGSFYVATRDERSSVSHNGKIIPLMQFIIETSSGLSFEKLGDDPSVYKVKIKDRSQVKFPHKLVLRDWKAGLPPHRSFDSYYLGSEDGF